MYALDHGSVCTHGTVQCALQCTDTLWNGRIRAGDPRDLRHLPCSIDFSTFTLGLNLESYNQLHSWPSCSL
jgi:hypothetical protein